MRHVFRLATAAAVVALASLCWSAVALAAPLNVFVGYADNIRSSPFFPNPWQGSPNTIFLGNGPTFDAGAILLQNTTSTPQVITNVTVQLPANASSTGGGATFSLWGSFIVPANGNVILTQNAGFNFDTSDFPVTSCGNTLPNGNAGAPTVTITGPGGTSTLVDTGHVLNTGGFDFACIGNESLQWRPIGTTGIGNPGGQPPGTVPEPGSLALLGSGLLTLAGVVRRKLML